MMNLSGKRVLVTGAGGFIGSHLTELLVHEGAEVRAFCKYNGRGDLGKISQLPETVFRQLEIQSGDLQDPFVVDRAVEDRDIVFHLAALIGIPYSYLAPADYVATNITGTLNVLEACRRHQVTRVLQTSTSEVYGSAVEIPMNEKHRLHPQSPYAASKVASDSLALSYFRSFDTPVVVVRPFNTFGPRQSTRAVIPTIFRQLMDTGELKLGSLTPRRDFTYVTDTARGFIELAQCDSAIGETVNLGTGMSHSIEEIAGTCMKIAGKTSVIHCENKRIRPDKSEVDHLQADVSKVKQLCNWSANIDFETGLRLTFEDLKLAPPSLTSGYSI
ncbi:MAG: SDR family NAD(P)-dependent oxidoreductase [Pirellulaceae bacterium]|jgi:NAD dependent epimerase/dehydratase|nr:SDR family NAD(P)-dependent oxidoreductase [Pirellulaceae bacterium]MDP7377270.1 SDR family NAD(P)-dependent oxidoreductase [Pirellulaceae bacterium]